MNAPDGMERFIERVTENTGTRLITKVVLPIVTLLLLPLIGVQWNGMRDDIRDVKVRQDKQAENVAGIDQRVTTIDTKLDAGLIWRLTQLERRFDTMESRIEARNASQGQQYP